MDDICEQVQKQVVGFCTHLEPHTEKWRLELQSSDAAVRALINQAEQLRHVEKTDLINVDGFQNMKDRLKCSIYNGIEEELVVIKDAIVRLNKANSVLKNKLFTLEKTTLELDWDQDNALIKGNAIQPPLSKILIYGLEFWQFFNKHLQNISDNFKRLDLMCEKSVASFASSFVIDFEETCVRYLIALTQYIDNVKCIN
ncbi:hypothetical protein FQR65_LT07971 [Abscondita terminalis]|nr:hypothetical protein FQR65_LT07971 [Abscondita terminalis]